MEIAKNSLWYMRSGFGLVEMLIVCAILALLVVVSYVSFVNSDKNQALVNDVAKVTSLIDRARSLTLSSQNASQYGVHIEASRVVLFAGSEYSEGSPLNRIETLNPRVIISSFLLNGGGQDVVFQRLTGKTDNFGTISLALVSDPASVKVVTINATGLSDQQ